jgi:hypothetical protein
MPKYIVHYVTDSSPELKVFYSKARAEKFVSKLIKKEDRENGTWFDFLIKGEVMSCDYYYKGFLKQKK